MGPSNAASIGHESHWIVGTGTGLHCGEIGTWGRSGLTLKCSCFVGAWIERMRLFAGGWPRSGLSNAASVAHEPPRIMSVAMAFNCRETVKRGGGSRPSLKRSRFVGTVIERMRHFAGGRARSGLSSAAPNGHDPPRIMSVAMAFHCRATVKGGSQPPEFEAQPFRRYCD